MRKFLVSSLAFTTLLSADLSTFDSNDYEYLNQLALKSGADKGSQYHNYTEVYSQFFHSIKDLPIKFLEIGINKGNSVKLWEDYFKNAELHFIDITLANVEYMSQRSKYHVINQENQMALEQFVKENGDFDVILDDGGHMMQQQIVSFLALFPHIKKGGMYIIEDLHTSYWPSYGGGKHAATTIAFLKHLIDDLNFVGQTSTRASHLNLDPTYLQSLSIHQREIESIHFYDSTVIIKKRL